MKALRACNEFYCVECPYQHLDSNEYSLRCIHTLIKDINKLLENDKSLETLRILDAYVTIEKCMKKPDSTKDLDIKEEDRPIKTSKIYSMIYDDPKYGNNGHGDYLGEFKRVKQLREDAWVDDFIGINIETDEVCLVLSREVCGYGGGIAYQAISIPELTLKK